MGLFQSSLDSASASIIYHPPETVSYQASAVEMLPGQIAFLHVPLDSEAQAPPRTTLLYCHGNACDVGQVRAEMSALARLLECNLVLWDYPGYGQSGGRPSQRTIFSAVEAVYRHYAQRYATATLLIMGTSLGTGPACYLASLLDLEGEPYDGLILESPLLSVLSTGFPGSAPTLSVSSRKAVDLYRNERYIRDVRKPAYIIHGDKDRVIPVDAARSLSASAPNLWQLWIVPGAGHHDLRSRQPDLYREKLLAFKNAAA